MQQQKHWSVWLQCDGNKLKIAQLIGLAWICQEKTREKGKSYLDPQGKVNSWEHFDNEEKWSTRWSGSLSNERCRSVRYERRKANHHKENKSTYTVKALSGAQFYRYDFFHKTVAERREDKNHENPERVNPSWNADPAVN